MAYETVSQLTYQGHRPLYFISTLTDISGDLKAPLRSRCFMIVMLRCRREAGVAQGTLQKNKMNALLGLEISSRDADRSG